MTLDTGNGNYFEVTGFSLVPDLKPVTKKGPFLVININDTFSAINQVAAQTAGISLGELANLISHGGALKVACINPIGEEPSSYHICRAMSVQMGDAH